MMIVSLILIGFIFCIALIWGIYISNSLYELKKICKRKELDDICDYLNTKEVYIRDKDCRMVSFEAHKVHYVNQDSDKIIIDLK